MHYFVKCNNVWNSIYITRNNNNHHGNANIAMYTRLSACHRMTAYILQQINVSDIKRSIKNCLQCYGHTINAQITKIIIAIIIQHNHVNG